MPNRGFRDRLHKLFSTQVVVRRIGKGRVRVVDTSRLQSQGTRESQGRQLYSGVHSSRGYYTPNNSANFHATKLELYRDYECLSGDTEIPMVDGSKKTLLELSELYPTKSDKFYVYSYDHENDRIQLGEAHSVRKTKTAQTYKVLFDDGSFLIATENHPFLMRDGNYKRVDEINVGDSVMPLELTLNYTIVSIEKHDVRDVYDMTVEKYHNFATTICFVHNSMDQDPILSSALDIYADESTKMSPENQMLEIVSTNEDVKKILHNLFYDILNIEFNLWPWIRNTCKYGDFYLLLDLDEELGVKNVIPIGSYDMERLEQENPENPYEVVFRYVPMANGILNSTRTIYQYYEVAHFRLMSDTNFLPYGRCLARDSYIQTEYGMTTIDKIVKGDKVYSLNVAKNTFELVDVLATCNSGDKKVYTVSTKNNSIKASKEHPVLVYDPKKESLMYKKVSDLTVGDLAAITKKIGGVKEHIFSKELSLEPITGIQYSGIETTYDIQVSANSNFIANGIVVHNSMIESARKEFKRLTLMEDAMMIHRIMRAPQRRVYNVAVGNLNPAEVEQYMQKIIDRTKKIPYVDERGQYNLKFNLQNMVEDIYIPDRGGGPATKVDTLEGMSQQGFIDDINYVRNKMMAALKIPKTYLGYDEQAGGKCISPDTKIPLLSGITKTVLELIEDFKNGVDNYVYSIDETTKNIVPGKITWAGFTRLDAEIVRVWLDNDKYIDCTPDHLFLTRDGNWIPAERLSAGQSLMPWYTKNGGYKGNYTEVYHPGSEQYQLVHQLVSNYYGIKIKGKVIHHIDFNSRNNNPKNLDGSMTYTEHQYMPLAKENRGFMNNYVKEFKNHKVLKIEFLKDRINTCDLTVDTYHNFATDAGVIIHNSVIAAEDIRFARTIERIQSIVVSELSKIAIIHLHLQGYEDYSLVNFDLKLHNPSIIYERQRVEVLKEKIDLIIAQKESRFFSREYIYKYIFSLSDSEIEKEEARILKDLKLEFRMRQLAEEGNDPAQSGQIKGTAHTVAQMHSKDDDEEDDEGKISAKDVTDKEETRGRPEDLHKFSTSRDQDNGRDPLGYKDTRKNLRPEHLEWVKGLKDKFNGQSLKDMLD